MHNNIAANTFHTIPDANINANPNALYQSFFNMMIMTIMGVIISSSTNAIPSLVRNLLFYFWIIVDKMSTEKCLIINVESTKSTYSTTSVCLEPM